MHTRTLAPILAAALAAGALAPAAPAEPAQAEPAPATNTDGKEMATGPGSSEFTQEEKDNALRFLGLLVGVGALLATVIGGIVVFAGPHLGLTLPKF